MPNFFEANTMPKRTYGGRAAGGPTMMDHAMNMLGGQGMNAAAMGSQYGPMHQAQLGMAPTTAGGYFGQMANQNPGGRFFGGALPAYGNSSGGNVRPMFMGAPQTGGGGVTPQMAQGWGQAHSPYFDTRTGTMSQEHLGGYSPEAIGGMQISGQGPNYKAPANLGQMQQDYFTRTAGNNQMRAFNVSQKAYAKGDARARRMGNLSNDEFMQMNIPGYANQQLQNQNSQGWMGLQGQMFHQKQMADAHNGYMNRMSQLAGALSGMNLPPGQQQQIMAHIFGQLGVPGTAASGQPTGTGRQRANYSLTPQQQGQIAAAKTPKEKEALLNSLGVMDPITRQQLLGVGGQPPQGLASQFGDWAARGVLNIPHYLNPGNWGSNGPAAFESSGPQGYMQQWLNPYQITGQSQQTKRTLAGKR